MRSLLLLALSGLFGLLASCEMSRGNRPDEDEMTASAVLDALDLSVLWVVVEEEVGRSGFRLDGDRTSPGRGEFETHWVVSPAPFQFDGRRRKFVGRIREIEGVPGRYQVLIAAWVQRNADLKEPMDPAKGVWQDVERDADAAEELVYRIERHFLPYDYTPEKPDEFGSRD